MGFGVEVSLTFTIGSTCGVIAYALYSPNTITSPSKIASIVEPMMKSICHFIYSLALALSIIFITRSHLAHSISFCVSSSLIG